MQYLLINIQVVWSPRGADQNSHSRQLTGHVIFLNIYKKNSIPRNSMYHVTVVEAKMVTGVVSA